MSDDAATVHWCDWADQPNVHIACGEWTTPKLGGSFKEDLAAVEPFLAESGQLYAFSEGLVTCERCREAIARPPPTVESLLKERDAARAELLDLRKNTVTLILGEWRQRYHAEACLHTETRAALRLETERADANYASYDRARGLYSDAAIDLASANAELELARENVQSAKELLTEALCVLGTWATETGCDEAEAAGAKMRGLESKLAAIQRHVQDALPATKRSRGADAALERVLELVSG